MQRFLLILLLLSLGRVYGQVYVPLIDTTSPFFAPRQHYNWDTQVPLYDSIPVAHHTHIDGLYVACQYYGDNLLSEVLCDGDIPFGPCYRYEHGRLRSITSYDCGDRTGPYQEYDTAGILTVSGQYICMEDTMLHDFQIVSYDPLTFEQITTILGNYQRSVRDGLWLYYDHGALVHRELWCSDVLQWRE